MWVTGGVRRESLRYFRAFGEILEGAEAKD
jgi:hypothetical protein